MATLELVLLLLAAVLVSAVLDQFIPKVTSPLIQIALGLVIALFAKDYINVELDPALFLVLFIAPLLYNDAREADKGALWANKRPVAALAIGLVIVTALVVGFAVHALIPSIPLTAAIALGAALGPTDAVAVASLPKSLNIGERERSILKGECLINDASGIVSFQFAVAACITGAFSLWDASVSFCISFFGGILVGAILGTLTNFITGFVRERGLDSTTFHVLFDVFTPFIVFLAAEPFGASGVIAVVTAGLVGTMGKRQLGPDASRVNIVSSSVWKVLSFGLNGIVFVLLGTQLPKAMESTWGSAAFDNGFLVGTFVGLALLVELIRFFWLMGSEAIHNRRQGAPLFSKASLRSALIMTLAGAKGTVTLSIAFTLPLFDSLGDPFPQRQLIIFLACGAILVTLLLANFAIPLLVGKKISVNEAQSKEDEREAKIEILRNVIEDLVRHQNAKDRRATAAVIRSYNERIDRIKTNECEEDPAKTQLRLQVIHWERDYVEKALAEGQVEEADAYYALHRLSRRENLLTHSKVSPALSSKINQMRFFIRSLVHRIINGLPLVSVSDQAAAVHQLTIECTQYANRMLRDLLKDSGDIPTEYVSQLLVEGNRSMALLRPQRPSITRMAATDDAAVDILRRGLALELEGINEMQEAGRISRASAKLMRENVALMQIDLEEKV